MQELLPNIFKVYRDEGSGGWGYSYLVKRPQGNLFFARMAKTASIENEYDAIQAVGGISRIYITDFHFAGVHVEQVSKRFGAEVYCSQIEVPKLKKNGIKNIAAFEYVTHPIEEMLTVIPTPGHTAGGVCYMLTMDGKLFLFTGDFLYFGGDDWIVGSKDYSKVKASLDRIEGLEFDYLIGCGDDALGDPYVVLDAPAKRAFFQAIEDQFKKTP